MKLFRRILFLLLLSILAIAVFQNQYSLGTPLEFSFLHWSFSLVLGFWILLAFAFGVALFALVDAWRGMLLRLEIRRRDQEIAHLNAALHAAEAALAARPDIDRTAGSLQPRGDAQTE